jgi:hypothetical protein
MKKATYTNTALNETHTITGVQNLAKAWNLVDTVCGRLGWNHIDVKVKFTK